MTIRLPDVIAATNQQFLQLEPFVARQHAFVTRPVLREGTAATHSIGKMADSERIGLGRIVSHDHTKVMQHQEARSLNTGRYKQEGLILRARESRTVRPRYAMTLPFANRQLPAAIAEHEIEIRRHHDFVT